MNCGNTHIALLHSNGKFWNFTFEKCILHVQFNAIFAHGVVRHVDSAKPVLDNEEAYTMNVPIRTVNIGMFEHDGILRMLFLR